MPSKIVILDDEPERIREMTRCIENSLPDYRLFCFDNAPDLISWLSENLEDISIICLDHDLGIVKQ